MKYGYISLDLELENALITEVFTRNDFALVLELFSISLN